MTVMQANKRLMVKKRSGRLEPFDSRKMTRAISRAGVRYLLALEISKSIKNNKSLASKRQISSTTLRKMVSNELEHRNHGTVAKSYLGYKKSKSIKEKIDRSRKHLPKVRKQTRSHAKKSVRHKDIKSGRPPKW